MCCRQARTVLCVPLAVQASEDPTLSAPVTVDLAGLLDVPLVSITELNLSGAKYSRRFLQKDTEGSGTNRTLAPGWQDMGGAGGSNTKSSGRSSRRKSRSSRGDGWGEIAAWGKRNSGRGGREGAASAAALDGSLSIDGGDVPSMGGWGWTRAGGSSRVDRGASRERYVDLGAEGRFEVELLPMEVRTFECTIY